MIFNMTGGGGIAGSGSGAGLNFKVVGGTTQPSNPSENTIWVNTDKEITGWIFSAKNPFIGEIVESASVLSGTVGTSALNQTGYSFRKVNDGKAVAAFFNSSSSVGVMLVSRDMDACKISKVPKITTIDTTTTIEAENSFIYDGETYYYAYILFNKAMYYILDAEPIDCTSYAVLANALAPTYNIDNKVWIKSGEISAVSFNALKKNGIMVYPLCAKQYVDGAWVGKAAKSFQNGEWVEWLPEGALYWHGNECVDITGGWACKAWKMQPDAGGSASSETFEIARNSDHLMFTKTGLYGAVMYAANPIDLTNVKTIRFKGEMYSGTSNDYWARFCVWSSINGSYWSSNAVATKNGVKGKTTTEFSLDVSAIDDGEYYIGFGIYNKDCYVKVEELCMEVVE